MNYSNLKIALLFICLTGALVGKAQTAKPVFGVGYILNGTIKSDTIGWSDNMKGVNAYVQIPDVFSALVEVNALTNVGPSKFGFKYHFSGKFGAGTVLFQKRRLNIPLYLNIGYAYTVIDNIDKDLQGITLGFKGSINFFITQKISLVGRYSYDFCYGGEAVRMPLKKEIKDFSYDTKMISVGITYTPLRNF
jgi:hypothetical protein